MRHLSGPGELWGHRRCWEGWTEAGPWSGGQPGAGMWSLHRWTLWTLEGPSMVPSPSNPSAWYSAQPGGGTQKDLLCSWILYGGTQKEWRRQKCV